MIWFKWSLPDSGGPSALCLNKDSVLAYCICVNTDEYLEHFSEKSSGGLKFFLQKRGLPTGVTQRSLAARALIAFEQKKPIVATAENLSNRFSKDYLILLKEWSLCFDRNEDFLMYDDLNQFPKTIIGQVFKFLQNTKSLNTEYVWRYKIKKPYFHNKS